MAEDKVNLSDIVNHLPQKLQLRFNSLGSYVQSIVEDEKVELNLKIRISSDEMQFIQLAAFIFSLDSFFNKGTSAARDAALTFEHFGSLGFEIGSKSFTKNNANTLRGEKLARVLKRTVSETALGRVVARSTSIKQLVQTLLKELADGKTLGRQ